MTEVWKSQPRHFCEFCKCWIADNKPSREFHESGKRHQENVKQRIHEVRKSAVRKEKQENEHNSYLQEMERNALKAFKKDVKKNPALAAEVQKKKNVAKSVDKPESKKSSTKSEPSSEVGGEKGEWQVAFSDEGYPYYWNDVTSEVTWVKPKDYIEKTSDTDIAIPEGYSAGTSAGDTTTVDVAPEEDTAPLAATGEVAEEMESEAPTIEPEQEPPPPGLDDIASIPLPGSIPLPTDTTATPPPEPEASEPQPPSPDSEPETSTSSVKLREATKRPHNQAYGGWETVTHEEEEEYVDLQLPQQEAVGEEKVVVISEPKFKFKEKKVNALGADLIAFKKRKQATRSLKQRTTDT